VACDEDHACSLPETAIVAVTVVGTTTVESLPETVIIVVTVVETTTVVGTGTETVAVLAGTAGLHEDCPYMLKMSKSRSKNVGLMLK